MIGKDGTVYLGPWPKGMNNRHADHALPEGTMRNAVDVDINNTGDVARRRGYEKVYSGLNVRDGFDCEAGTFIVENGVLKRLDDEWAATDLLDGIYGDACTFCYLNGTVYFSDGLVAKKITDAGVTDWGMGIPPAPVLSPVAGTFGGGAYLAALTFVDVFGNESGASQVVQVTAPDDCGLLFDQLPMTTDPQVIGLRLYLSKPNGLVLYQCITLAPGAASFLVDQEYDYGKELETQFMAAPPPGRIIRHYKGRLYVADGPMVWHTEPFSPDLVRAGKNGLPFPAPVTVVEPVASGIWIVADKTYFMAGSDTDDFSIRPVLDYGAVFGTGQKIPNSANVAWFSTRGVIVAGEGEVKNIQEENVAPDTGESGAMIVKEGNGLRQAVVSLRNPEMSRMAANTFFDAEVIRRGV